MESALEHPTRAAALNFLRQRGPASCATISAEIGVAKDTLSHHLNVLTAANYVRCTEENGRLVYASRRVSRESALPASSAYEAITEA